MNSDFNIIRLKKENFDKIQEVYNGTRALKTPVEFFNKKFISNCKKNFISIMYFDNDKPIAHCAAIPFNIENPSLSGTSTYSAQVIDAVTLPEYQGKGLFYGLNYEINKISESEDFQVLFRFPSPQNYNRVVNKFGFTHTESFKVFDFNFRVLIPWIKLFQKFKLEKLSNFYLKMLSVLTFSKGITIENSLKNQGFYHIPHNQSYFQYKTYSSNYPLNIFGDKYWVKNIDGLVVGDYQIRSERNFLMKLKWFCFLTGIHRVRFAVCSNTREFELLSKLQQPTEGIPICIKLNPNANMNINEIKFTYADLDTF
jgi:hypothetical protein